MRLLMRWPLPSSPIAIAILGAVLIEHELDGFLRKRLRIVDDDLWEELIEERGFLSTFSRKIMAGHALHLYDDAIRDNLNIVRAVRNAFAHSKRLIDFDHPLVSRELKRIKTPKKHRRAFRKMPTLSPKGAYTSLCYWLVIALIHRQKAALSRSSKRRQKKQQTSSFYQTLAPYLDVGGLAGLGTSSIQNPLTAPATIKSRPRLFRRGHSGDPKTSTRPIGVSDLFEAMSKNDDNKDK
jgi:hypothetical protein